jgi:CBS domain-containing protein
MACRIQNLIQDPIETLDAAVDVQNATAFMAERDIGSVLVTRHGQVIGLFTEKDLIRRVIGPGKDPKLLTLGEVCSRKLVSVHEDTSCETAIKTMHFNNCRRLLVYRGETLKGVVTLPAIARAMAGRNNRSNTLLNLVSATTLVVTLAVIGFGVYQLPQMARIAMAVMK